VTMKNGRAFLLFLEEVEKTIQEAWRVRDLGEMADALRDAVVRLREVTGRLTGIALEGKIELFLADATLYLEMFGIVAIAWQWLLQAIEVQEALGRQQPEAEFNFYKGKLYACRFFFAYELPRIEGPARRLMQSDGLTLKIKEAFFED